MVVELLHDARQLDFMVALGTHPALPEESCTGWWASARRNAQTTFRHVGLLNHAWDDPAALTSLGVIEQDEIRQIAGPSWHPSLPDAVDIRINKAVLEYDHILILGPGLPARSGRLLGRREVPVPRHLRAGYDQRHPLAGRAGDRRRHDRHQGHARAGDDPCRGAAPDDARSRWPRWSSRGMIWRRHSSATGSTPGERPRISPRSGTSAGATEPYPARALLRAGDVRRAVDGGQGHVQAGACGRAGRRGRHLRAAPGCGQPRPRQVHLRGGLSHPALLPGRLGPVQARPARRAGAQHPRARVRRDGRAGSNSQRPRDAGEQDLAETAPG